MAELFHHVEKEVPARNALTDGSGDEGNRRGQSGALRFSQETSACTAFGSPVGGKQEIGAGRQTADGVPCFIVGAPEDEPNRATSTGPEESTAEWIGSAKALLAGLEGGGAQPVENAGGGAPPSVSAGGEAPRQPPSGG